MKQQDIELGYNGRSILDKQPSKSDFPEGGQTDRPLLEPICATEIELQDKAPSLFSDDNEELLENIKNNGESRSALENQNLFMKKYALQFEIPAWYVLDTELNNKFPDYFIQLLRCVFPEKEQYVVDTHFLDGRCQESSFKEIYNEQSEGLILKLLHRDNQCIHMEDQMILKGVRQAFVEFSECGNLFTVLIPQHTENNIAQQIIVCEVGSNMNELFKTIKNGEKEKYLCHHVTQPGVDLSFVKCIRFDQNRKYMIGYGLTKIFTLCLETNDLQLHQVDINIYEHIFDLNFRSEADGTKQCFIACKRKRYNQIIVFDIFAYNGVFDELSPNLRIMNFKHDATKELLIKISDDFQKVVFTSCKEQYIIEQKHGESVQRKLFMVENKIVYFIKEVEDGFFFLAAGEYSKSLQVEHSHRKEKVFKIERNFEPGIIKAFDFNVQKEKMIDGSSKFAFRFLSMRDDEFLFDYLQLTETACLEEKCSDMDMIFFTPTTTYNYQDKKHDQYIFTQMRAFSVGWPYVAFSQKSNYIVLANAFDRKCIQRIQICEEGDKITILDSYITDTYDLFILTQELEKNCGCQQTFKLYMIDLDASNPNKNGHFNRKKYPYKLGKPIFSYTDKNVEERQFWKMYVRGSSRKEEYSWNEKQFVYFHHRGIIYYWVDMFANRSDDDKLQVLAPTDSNQLYYVKDGCFIFLQNEYDKSDSTKLIEQRIMKLKTKFSSFILKPIMKRNSDNSDKIKTINMDNSCNQVMILIKKQPNNSEGDKITHSVIFFDSKKKEKIFEVVLTNPELIGRFKSGLFQLTNSHIYFNNDVIKVRMDLIAANKNTIYTENEIFDSYNDVFELENHMTIRTGTPLDSSRYRRFVFILQDGKMAKTKTILITPYLHERRIYLNRIKINTEYFYTAVQTLKNQKYINSLKDDNFNDMLEILSQKKESEDQYTSIICMNLMKETFYVYSPTGLLINRVSFKEQAENYGNPIASSSNGQFFIFKKMVDKIKQSDKSDKEKAEEYMTIYIFHLSVFKFTAVKKINLVENICEEINSGKSMIKDQNKIKGISWLLNLSFEQIDKYIRLKCVVNDNLGVCVRIRLNYEQNTLEKYIFDKFKNYDLINSSIYYYESKCMNLKSEKNPFYIGNKLSKKPTQTFNTAGFIDQVNKISSTFIREEKSFKENDFILNPHYIFFWSGFQVVYSKLLDKINVDEMESLNFSIGNDTTDNTMIKEIRAGSDPTLVVLVVQQSLTRHTIFSWSTQKNIQLEAFDVGSNYDILWDKLGNPYIISDNKVIFNKERCAITAFDFEPFHEKLKKNSINKLTNQRSHRFDYEYHNWLISQQYISLGFSYLAFAQKHKIELSLTDSQKIFDPNPYNYLFNRGTCFTDGEFVKWDHKQLHTILQNFEQIDKTLLELLIYTTKFKSDQNEEDINSALHKAVRVQNNRNVDIILNYMSKISYNSSQNFSSIFDQLVEYMSFVVYLRNILEQTSQMKKKQVLRLRQTFSDKIVAMSESTNINTDSQFFKTNMQEVSTGVYKSHSVKLVAFKVGWIINTDQGRKFLDSIQKKEVLEYFKIPSIIIITEFLYRKYKMILTHIILPFFIFQAACLKIMIYNFELYYIEIDNNKSEPDENGVIWIKGSEESKKRLVAPLCMLGINSFVGTVLIFFQIYLPMRTLGTAFLKRFYSIVDLIYSFLNFIIAANFIFVAFHNEWNYEDFSLYIQGLRATCSFTVLFIYIKAGYFLSLTEGCAPLLDQLQEVFWDIRYFMLIIFLYTCGFATAFTILAQSQLQFDNITQQEKLKLEYGNFLKSVWYVYNSYVLGGKSQKSFELGNGSQHNLLIFLYFLATFIFVMVLFKMLVALMGSTFAKRSKVIDEITIRDKLGFVMDNWHLIDRALKDKAKVKYIISALPASFSHDDSIGVLAQINSDIKLLEKQGQNNFIQIEEDIQRINYIVQTILKENQSEVREVRMEMEMVPPKIPNPTSVEVEVEQQVNKNYLNATTITQPVRGLNLAGYFKSKIE